MTFGALLKAIRHPASLRERAINAGLWNLAPGALGAPLRIAGNLVTTRILAPEAFALVATITIVHQGLLLISDIGLMQSVMRDRRGEEPRFLCAVWTLQAIRGAILVGCLLAFSGALALVGPAIAAPGTVYADPLLPWLLAASAFGLFLRGFESTNVYLAMRRLKVARVHQIQIAITVVNVALVVLLVVLTGSVWGVVAAGAVTAALRLALTHLALEGPRMALVWDRAVARDLWSFGRWLIGSSLGAFALNNCDRLIFGMLIDSRAFGVYAIAVIWVEALSTLVKRVGGSVVLPALREGFEKARAVDGPMVKMLGALLALAACFYLAELVVAAVLIDALYIPPFTEAKIFILALAARILLIPFEQYGQVLLLEGRSRAFGITVMVSAAITLGAAYLAAREFSLVWAAAVYVAALALPAFAFMAHPSCRGLRLTPLAAAALATIVALHLALAAALDGGVIRP